MLIGSLPRRAVAQALLHLLPNAALQDWFMLAGMVFPIVSDLSDVDRIGQELIQRAA